MGEVLLGYVGLIRNFLYKSNSLKKQTLILINVAFYNN